jgi:hypothetical protein
MQALQRDRQLGRRKRAAELGAQPGAVFDVGVLMPVISSASANSCATAARKAVRNQVK